MFRRKKLKAKPGKGIGKCPVSGKSQYENDDQARKGMNFLFRMDPNIKIGDLHVYECPDCKFLHVGHIDKRKQVNHE